SLEEIFKEINRQTGYNFLWSARKIKNTPGIDAHFENMPVTTVLDRILTGLPLTYTIEENTIIIQKKEEGDPPGNMFPGETKAQQPGAIRGTVTDTAGFPLPGVSVMVRGSANGVSTNE